MASRSGGGMGVTVALVIFILVSLSLLLTTMLFYTKKEQAEQELATVESDVRAFAPSAERERDDFQQIRNQASTAGKSVVSYLRDELKQTMYRAAGNREMTLAGFEAQLSAQDIGDTQSLMAAFRDRRSQAMSERERADSLQEQLDIAESTLADYAAEREELLADHRATLASQNAEIERIQNRADEFGDGVDEAKRDMDRRVADIRNEYENRISDLTAQLEDAQNRMASQSDAIEALQGVLKEIRPDPGDESLTADATVLEVQPDGSLFVDGGRRDRITLGMRFEVYGDVTETRRGADGSVPLGKATIEIVRVDESTSLARVVRSTPGRAVVASDVLVNPVYDRDKMYKFYVFGNFDLDGVNGPTELETETVKSRIREWGGEVLDEFREDMDFLVLGLKPQEPGPLPPNATGPVVQRLVAQRRFLAEYEENAARAGRLSIPVLNQNRLFTLIGYYGP